jgi:hypothetical protein
VARNIRRGENGFVLGKRFLCDERPWQTQIAARPSALSAETSDMILTGHKLPTGYPSRRAWLHFTVTDRTGRIVFESGAFASNGAITGNDNDADTSGVEPHHTEIRSADQVQIYESVMSGSNGRPTTGLLTAVRYLKDNRLVPRGFGQGDRRSTNRGRGIRKRGWRTLHAAAIVFGT